MKNIAILGASGFIGRHLYESLSKSNRVVGSAKSRLSSHLEFLDLLDRNSINTFLQNTQPDVIIYLAGCKNVKFCEENPAYAYANNIVALKNTVDALKQVCPNTHIIYFSSDYVFDGKSGSYSEADTLSPKTVYGQNKKEAEFFIKNFFYQYTIIRTSAVMGAGGDFFEWLVKSLKSDASLDLFSNVYFTPTPTQLLEKALLEIVSNINRYKNMTLHIVHPQKLSRYAFGVMCKDILAERAKAVCVPTEKSFDSPLLPKDLSMIPSRFIRDDITMPLAYYLAELL